MVSVRREALIAAWAGGVGLGLGVMCKLADESRWDWVSDVANYPSAFLLLIAVVAATAPSLGRAALRSAVVFGGLVVGYYLWSAQVLGFLHPPSLIAWGAAAVSVVPAVAALVRWAFPRRGLRPGAVLALAAGLAVAGGGLPRVLLWWQGFLPREVAAPVQAVVDLVVAALIVLVMPRHSSTRLWAVALLVPATLAVGRLTPLFFAIFVGA